LSSVNGGCSVYFMILCDEVATFLGLSFCSQFGSPPMEGTRNRLLFKKEAGTKLKLLSRWTFVDFSGCQLFKV
jgi:hypothetical protein